MEPSILKTIKTLLGISETTIAFDDEITAAINSVMFSLSQMGIGENGFRVIDDSQTWEQYLSDISLREAVKSYIHLKVKMIFDPPTSTNAVEAINATISELEWRLYIDAGNY